MATRTRSVVIGVVLFTFIVLTTIQTTNITGNTTTNDVTLMTLMQHHSVDSNLSSRNALQQCNEPVHKLIFIKTHKTGSSTIATTLIRYADEKHLKLATPIFAHIFHEVKPFNRDMVLSFGDMGKFDMLVNHARYNRREMDMVVSKPKYITILRDPVKQIESAYSFYAMGKHIEINAKENHDLDLEAFLKQPKYYFDNIEYHVKEQSWNGQIFDLGLDHKYHMKKTFVQNKTHSLDKEMELVMIKEYFDESLLLLRKQLCWQWKDIVYISTNVRKQSLRHDITLELAAEIRQWNSADVQLYDHFNRTFWRKIADYGPDFQQDLLYFQKLKKTVSTICVESSHNDKRVEVQVLKANAPSFCKRIIATPQQYVVWLEIKYISYCIILPLAITLSCSITLLLLYRCYKHKRGYYQSENDWE